MKKNVTISFFVRKVYSGHNDIFLQTKHKTFLSKTRKLHYYIAGTLVS